MALIVPLQPLPNQTSNIQLGGEHDCYVYLHRRPDSGDPFYVGKGRLNRAYSVRARNRHWNGIVSKYGFTVEIIKSGLLSEEALAEEVVWIAYYRSLGFKLCNMTNGGDGGSGRIVSEAERTKKAILATKQWQSSEHRIRHTEKTIGRKRTPEMLQRMSLAHQNRPKDSEETRRRKSEAGKRNTGIRFLSARIHKGKALPVEHCLKISNGKINKGNKLSKAYMCVETGVVFANAMLAIRWLRSTGKLKACPSFLKRVCDGPNSAYGFHWQYAAWH